MREGVGTGVRKIIRTLDTRQIKMHRLIINAEELKSNINKYGTKSKQNNV